MKQSEFTQKNNLCVHSDFYDLLKRHRLNYFEALYDLAGGELFKKNRYRSVVRIYLKGEDGRSHIFHLKRHHPPLLTRLKTIFSGFRIPDGAENEWSKILRLEEIGIQTMTPVAFGAVRKWGLPYRALTMTEHLYGAEKLEEYFPAHFSGTAPDSRRIAYKRKIIRETARLARRLHGSGFHHQDFYLGHIFIKPGEGNTFTLHLIDLQRVREHQKLRKSRVIKDLAQINFSASQLDCLTGVDRLRFLKAYLDKDRVGSVEKDLIRKIERKTERIEKHTRKLLAGRERGRLGRGYSVEPDKKSKVLL